jgi:uncharacterized membrane protein
MLRNNIKGTSTMSKILAPALASLALVGCMHGQPEHKPLGPAPTVDAELAIVEAAVPRLDKAADDIHGAAASGRVAAPALPEWRTIEDGATSVRVVSSTLAEARKGLQAVKVSAADYARVAESLSKDKEQLARKIKEMEDDQTRSAIVRLAMFGAALVALGIILLWASRKLGIAAIASGVLAMAMARVLLRFLAMVDVAVTVALVAVPIALVAWLVYKYHRQVFGLVKSVQRAKAVLPAEARDSFSAELEKDQDSDVKAEVKRVRSIVDAEATKSKKKKETKA